MIFVQKAAQTSPQPTRTAPGTTPPAASPKPPVPGRRARAKAEKRARILRAARSLISEKGYAQMSMSEVAARADVAAGTVFQYAATKAELLMMVTESLWAGHIRERADGPRPEPRASSGTAADEIVELLAPFLEMSTDWPETTAWIAREILFGDDLPHRREVLALMEVLEERIAHALARCSHREARQQSARLDVGARMIITSCLAELNRVRQGRLDRTVLVQHLRQATTLVTDGVSR